MANVTIIDVAERAGVSFKTVSRVMNHEPNVGEATRARVLAAAAELGYRPRAEARSLAGSRSFQIGLFFDNPSEAYIAKLQRGAAEQCRRAGYQLVVEFVDSGAADMSGIVAESLRARPLDGVILSQPLSDRDEALSLLERRGLRYVRVSPDHDLERSPWVGMDDAAAAAAMTKRLIDLGHRDIGFVCGDPAHGVTALRRAGYVSALRDADLAVRPELIRPGRFDFRSGFEAAEALLDLDLPPTAIFASNDEMALGVTIAAHRRGLDLPGDLSIAGVDDIPAAAAICPGLTTVRQPIQQMGAAAVDLILAALGDERASPRRPGLRLEFEIVERGSIAAPASRDARRAA